MGLVAYGLDTVQWGEVYPVFVALVTSPIIGLFIAYILTVMLLNLFRRVRPSHANGVFRRLQLFSSGFVAFSHGANDAQKTMAIITLALFSSGRLPEFIVPTWVALAAAIAIGLGLGPEAGVSSGRWAPESSGWSPSTGSPPRQRVRP